MGEDVGAVTAVEGPIMSAQSALFGSATRAGSEEARLLDEFDYVEEEFFVSGTANTYGPEVSRPLADGEELYGLKPLSTMCERAVPFKTRVLVVRPRDMSRFTGVVHAIPFHNLGATAQVERHLVRRGDVWIGVEVCSGTRFGKDEIPSGGVANLHGTDPERYSSLVVAGGKPEHWPGLTPGAVAHAFETLDFGRSRGDAMNDVPPGALPELRVGPRYLLRGRRGVAPMAARQSSPGADVRRIYTSGASGASEILRPLVEYHHDRRSSADRPILDGYFIRVGQVPVQPARGAVLVVLQSENEALTNVESGEPVPDDTDEPRFRYYEIAGTGHRISADPPSTSGDDRRRSPSGGHPRPVSARLVDRVRAVRQVQHADPLGAVGRDVRVGRRWRTDATCPPYHARSRHTRRPRTRRARQRARWSRARRGSTYRTPVTSRASLRAIRCRPA